MIKLLGCLTSCSNVSQHLALLWISEWQFDWIVIMLYRLSTNRTLFAFICFFDCVCFSTDVMVSGPPSSFLSDRLQPQGVQRFTCQVCDYRHCSVCERMADDWRGSSPLKVCRLCLLFLSCHWVLCESLFTFCHKQNTLKFRSSLWLRPHNVTFYFGSSHTTRWPLWIKGHKRLTHLFSFFRFHFIAVPLIATILTLTKSIFKTLYLIKYQLYFFFSKKSRFSIWINNKPINYVKLRSLPASVFSSMFILAKVRMRWLYTCQPLNTCKLFLSASLSVCLSHSLGLPLGERYYYETAAEASGLRSLPATCLSLRRLADRIRRTCCETK